MSQEQRLLHHLQLGHSITRLQALTDLGIFELSARLCDLQKRGFKFSKNRITVTNRFGEKCSILEYRLVRE